MRPHQCACTRYIPGMLGCAPFTLIDLVAAEELTLADQKVTVILGAGASYDSWNGNGVPDEPWWPPLAKSLFGGHKDDRRPTGGNKIDRSNTFQNILLRYDGANTIAGDLQQVHIPTEFKFEEYLSSVAANSEMFPLFLHVPPYIRDIIWDVSRQFGRFSGNYTGLLTGLLARTAHEIMFVTLNYDTLLEQDLTRYTQGRYQFQNINDYIESGRKAHVVKIHGSVNWFKALFDYEKWPGDITEWQPALDYYGLDQLQDSIMVDNGIQRSDFFTVPMASKPVPGYPVITAPLADKGTDKLVCPPAHQQAAADFVSECKKFLIIGTSGNDQDLMTLLHENLKEVETVHYISEDEEVAASVKEKFDLKVPALRSTSVTELERGFGTYLQSRLWQDFCVAGT